MTIRFIALLTVCVAIASLSMPRQSKSGIVITARDLDIAIVGRGYFQLLNPNTSEIRYSRAGSLQLNVDGQLFVEIDDTEWLLDPPIHVPSDWERIAILKDGKVQVLHAGTWIDLGQLQVALFTSTTGFEDPLRGNALAETQGPPIHCEPGGNSSGVIQQGWLETRTEFYRALSLRVLIAVLIASVLAIVTTYHRPGAIPKE